MEESASGRNCIWLWREALAAITRSVVSTVRSHKLRAAVYAVAGWALWLVAVTTWRFLISALISPHGWGSVTSYALEYPLRMVPGFATTWLLARVDPRFSFAMTTVFSLSVFASLGLEISLRLPDAQFPGRLVAISLLIFAGMLAGGVLGSRTPARLRKGLRALKGR